MPKCPWCGENIRFVVYSYVDVGYKQLSANGRTKEWYPDEDFIEQCGDGCDCDRGYCQCPDCGKEIFTDDEEARKFLKGKK